MKKRQNKNIKKKLPSKPIYYQEQTKSQSQQSIVPIDYIKLANEAIMNLKNQDAYTIPVGRKEEIGIIESFLIKGITKQHSSSTLYIGGLPGIGKTLTVKHVIDSLKQNKEYSDKFDYWYFNAMNIKMPSHIYKALLSEIFDRKHQDPLYKLDKCFTNAEYTSKIARVLVLDEMDYLMTRDEEVLYNLFEWTHHKASKLIIIGISNTLDLTTMLKNKTRSRMGDDKIIFGSYDRQQMTQILKKKLLQIQIFSPESLRFACMKIIKFSTDIRKIVEILVCALKIFIQQNDSNQVTTQHIRLAFDQLIKNSPKNVYMNTMPRSHKLILLLSLVQKKMSGTQHSSLSRIIPKIQQYDEFLAYDDILYILKQMEEVSLLTMKEKMLNQADIWIIPSVSSDDVKVSIEDQEFESLIDSL